MFSRHEPDLTLYIEMAPLDFEGTDYRRAHSYGHLFTVGTGMVVVLSCIIYSLSYVMRFFASIQGDRNIYALMGLRRVTSRDW